MSNCNMAGYIHRGNGDPAFARQKSSVTLRNGSGKGNVYNPKALTTSPLQDFVKAKERINSLFEEVHVYVHSVAECLHVLSTEQEFVTKEMAQEADNYSGSVVSIQEVLSRDHMKVVFFGRTSNGKSSTINSMLHSKVLPTGLGHTTSCFISVEGSSTGEKFILSDSSQDHMSIESIDSLAHALRSKDLCADTLIRVFWPKEDSRLLENEVVLVDSPGIDVSQEYDNWIDKHCLDADVFVFVANSESTLTRAETNFFHNVSEKISKPNLFILNNRWDASAAEPESMDQVRAQHTSRLIKFLAEELQVCSAEEARHRIFFVSSREMLQHRLKERGLSSPSSGIMAEGYQARMLEFESFERQFELCISQSAINTKFDSHIEKARAVVQGLHAMLENVTTALIQEREDKTAAHEEKLSVLRDCQQSLVEYMKYAKDSIVQLSAEVQLKVSTDLSDELHRLSEVVDGFDKPFSDDEIVLQNYIMDLTVYIDGVLMNSLQVRFTGGLLQRILSLENEMLSRMCDLLPKDYSNSLTQAVQYRKPFEFVFALNCPSFMQDFNPDLNFRFSLGLTSLIRRFASMKSGGPDVDNQVFGSSMIPRPIARPSGEFSPTELVATEDAVMKSIIYTSATYVANGGVGLLLVGGVVYRAVGWRVLAVVGGLYALIYAYERLSWNARAKEKSFKDQFRRHLLARLQQFSNTLTMHCDNQVSRETQEHLCRIHKVANDALNDIKADVDALHKAVSSLEASSKEIATMRGKATFLSSELENFVETYLQMA